MRRIRKATLQVAQASACFLLASCGCGGAASFYGADAACTAFGSCACRGGQSAAPRPASTVTTTSAVVAPSSAGARAEDRPTGPVLSDAQIAGVAFAIDAEQIAKGRIALAHARGARAIAYARQTRDDHGSAQARLDVVLATARILPDASPLRDDVIVREEARKHAYEAASGPDFDRTYAQAEVEDQNAILALLDETMLAQARDPQLRAALRAMRAATVEHIQLAKSLREPPTP